MSAQSELRFWQWVWNNGNHSEHTAGMIELWEREAAR